MEISRALVHIVVYCFFRILSVSVKVDIINGRKDASTCCKQLPNSSFSSDCQTSYLWADIDEKYAYTPGFPNQFPIQRLCKWGIYTRPGKRIRLEFRDFYLIGPGDDGMCYSQGVIIKSPLSKLEMGPHCGNAGLPTVISAGNYLEVDLVSNIPMTSENYRGFKMSFIETVETPSPQLRPPNWGNGEPLTADPAVVEKIFPSATISSRGGRPVNSKTTSKPPRFRPGRKLGVLTPNIHSTAKRYYPPRTTSFPPTKSSNKISLEEIVGIVVGGIVLLGILVLVVIKWKQTRRKKAKNNIDKQQINKETSEYPSTYATEDHKNEADQEKPNIASAPGYYVYYIQKNEENIGTNHKSDKHISKRLNDSNKLNGKREKFALGDAKTSNKKKASTHTRRTRDIKTMPITRPRRRIISRQRHTKTKKKKETEIGSDKKDSPSHIVEKKQLGRKKRFQENVKQKPPSGSGKYKNEVSNEIEVFVIKKPRDRTKLKSQKNDSTNTKKRQSSKSSQSKTDITPRHLREKKRRR
ncbi:uncharacterized protein LOC120343186 [Styela clava]|uniref:uncharacterized protein LOC120343186 n=1 Tax=Styela clava TaxID=7725 RepID=UPI00193A7970|nr:uncharacterized protein LOC120343186 [Styela clava]